MAAALAAAALPTVGPSRALAPLPDWPPLFFKLPEQPSFTSVWDVKVAPDDSLWAADYGSHQIVNFDPEDAGGELRIGSGVPGNGDGDFNRPAALAVDARGNVYVAEQGNHRIQKFTSDGIFLTKWGSLGSGDGQFVYPIGVAVDASGSVYVTDLGNDRVEKFTSDGVFVTAWGSHGSGDGQFNFNKICSPRVGCGILMAGVAFDALGHVYIVDSGNGRIQKFTNEGTYLAQWPVGRFPGGVTVDAAGNVYVASWHDSRIQKFTGEGAALTAWGDHGDGDGAFPPEGIAVDRAGNVYAANGIRIQKFGSEGRFLEKYGTFGQPVRFRSPAGVAVDAAGDLYVADTGKPDTATGTSARIARFTSSGAYLGQFGSPGLADGLFTAPVFVAFDPAGNLFVLDRIARRVQKLAPDGTFLAKWPISACASGLAVDGAGDVYVTDDCNDRIHRYSGTGALVAEWSPHAPPPPPPQPPAQFADSAGDAVGLFSGSLDVPDLLGVTYEVQGDEVLLTQTFDRDVALNDSELPPPSGATVVGGIVEFDLDRDSRTGFCFGCIFGAPYRVGAEKHLFLDVVENGLIDLDPGLTATAAAEGATLRLRIPGAWLDGGACLSFGAFAAAGFEPVDFVPNEPVSLPVLGGCFQSGSKPSGVALDAAGVVYVAMSRGGTIQTFTRQGEFLGEWSAPQLGSPGALAFDRAGNLLVADTGNRRIERFTTGGVFLGQFDGEASSLAVDSSGRIHAADPANDRVRTFGADGAVLADLAGSPAPPGRFKFPEDAAFDADGNIYVLDSQNTRVQKFSPDRAYLTEWRVAGDDQFGPVPRAIDVGPDGVVYVLDSAGSRVQRFTSAGTSLGDWGSAGREEGQLMRPHDLAVDGAGQVYVADSDLFAGGRIQKFTADGRFLARVGFGSAVAVDAFGNVYGADLFDQRVRKFAPDGSLLAEWGSRGSGDGEFQGPLGIDVDSFGNVYVTDLRNFRVQMFTSRGEFVGKWGGLGAGDGQFSFNPSGLSVSPEGDLLVADSANHRVQAFRPVLHVRVDVKPGSATNSVNPASQGTIPVAILSSADLDAPARIDRASLTFGRTGEEASLASCGKDGEDVNQDGRGDLVCHFNTQTAGFRAEDTRGLLKGRTIDGLPIGGRDSVRLVA